MGQQTSVQSLFDSMSEMQKQFWSQLSKAGNSAPVGEQLERSYQQQLELGEQFVNQALKMQGEWMHQTCEALKGNEGTPKELRELIERSEQSMDQMLQTRAELWHGWFSQARALQMDNLPQIPGAEAWTRMLESVEQQVKETMHKAVEATDATEPAASGNSTGKVAADSRAK